MKRLIRKALLWLAALVAVLAILLVLFYAEEDWRGARDWAACQRELAAKGETLDLRQLAPPGKPEDDLSKLQLFAIAYQDDSGHSMGLIARIPSPPQLSRLNVYLGTDKRPKMGNSEEELGNFTKSQPTDLVVWQKFYRSLPEAHLPAQAGTPAQDILETLGQFGAQIDEIPAAVSKDNAFWSTDFDKPFLTPLEGRAFMVTLSEVLSLRAVAHLDNGEAGLAEQDYLLSLNLRPPLVKGCFITNYLMIRGILSSSETILWEGLHRHAWNQMQLSAMDSALASTDMVALAKQSFRVDRAAQLQMMEHYQAPDPTFLQLPEVRSDDSIAELRRLSLVRPTGWWDQDRRHFSLLAQHGIDALNVARGTINPASFAPEHETPRALWKMIYIPISMISGSTFDYLGQPIAEAETYRRLARLACRLEEYRLAHGQYPDQLDDLPDLPAHLNQEVLSEQPLRYRRKGDSYLLYSVGWNQKDDGGVPHEYFPPNQADDWPWPGP
jgi:hypothetical protein